MTIHTILNDYTMPHPEDVALCRNNAPCFVVRILDASIVSVEGGLVYCLGICTVFVQPLP